MSVKLARRDWLKQTAGVAVGAAIGSQSFLGGAFSSAASVPSKILNFNPSMGYRRFGRTGFMVSEVSLGGHYQYKGKEFHTQEMRNEVVEAALEAGINFFETTDTPGEDETTGEALRLLGVREQVYITHDFTDIRKGEWDRAKAHKESMRSIETGLKNFHTDYLDIWRPSALQTGGTSMDLIEWVVEAGMKAKEQGKIRHLGISSHNSKWQIEAINRFDEFDMVVMPYNYLFRQAEKELFGLVKEKDLGMMTIKPFLAESLFKREIPAWAKVHDDESTKFEGEYQTTTEGIGSIDRLAISALKFILSREEISCVVPGMSTPEEVRNNVKAAKAHKLARHEDRELNLAYNAATHHMPHYLNWLHSWRLS